MTTTRTSGYVWLNGTVLSSREAKISALDRGLLYGDGLFETVRVYRGEVFALEEHLARLRSSARFLGIPEPRTDWDTAIQSLLARNRLRGDAWVRLVLTRGAAAPGLLPPVKPKPTRLILAGPLDPNLAHYARRGVRVELVPFATEGPLAGHKTLDYLPALLAKQIAHRSRAYEGLYVDPRGYLSEGATSNLFLVRGDRLLTPPAHGILPGVTRGKVLAQAQRLRLRLGERRLRVTALSECEEAFLSSSLAEIVPIVGVGTQRLGSGRPGPVTRQLQSAYRTMTDAAFSDRLPRRAPQ